MTPSVRAAIAGLTLAGWCAVGGCSQSPPTRAADTSSRSTADEGQNQRTSAAKVGCRNLPSARDLREYLQRAPAEGGEAGGLFSGKLEWAAVVNRTGEICATAVATDDPASAWPGSQAIAKAKAYTANAYSTDGSPLSTARLYTLTQPGHSLWGVAQPNAFNPQCLEPPGDMNKTDGKLCGGQIAFGGG